MFPVMPQILRTFGGPTDAYCLWRRLVYPPDRQDANDHGVRPVMNSSGSP